MHFDESALAWHYDTWHWLLENFGGIEAMRKRRLILPTHEYFPVQAGRDHESALRLFQHLKELMGMKDWPCRLEQITEDEKVKAARKDGLIGEWSSNGPAGWFAADIDGEVVIAYQERQLENPVHLTATLVHELCHYLLRLRVRSHPPTGWADHEMHTDVMCSFMGFGVFVCNAVFDFQQWGDHNVTGWSWSRQGYLSESEHAYALALFCELTRTDPEKAAAYLKPNPLNYFGLAVDDLEASREQIAVLEKAVPLAADLPPILSVETEADGDPVIEKEPLENITFTFAEVSALGPEKPWYQPIWNFYYRLAEAQTGTTWHEMELATLDSLQPNLQAAALAIRFSLRFDGEGLQGAIIPEPDLDLTACEQMLERTIAAYEVLGDELRVRFLRSLHPEIRTHFEAIEKARTGGDIEEFFSPLDQDETWRGLEEIWLKGLRSIVLRSPRTLVHPA
jgi:hypothetical protein